MGIFCLSLNWMRFIEALQKSNKSHFFLFNWQTQCITVFETKFQPHTHTYLMALNFRRCSFFPFLLLLAIFQLTKQVLLKFLRMHAYFWPFAYTFDTFTVNYHREMAKSGWKGKKNIMCRIAMECGSLLLCRHSSAIRCTCVHRQKRVRFVQFKSIFCFSVQPIYIK